MATKYCDHGAYGNAVFNGYISNTQNSDNGVAGTVLTVTSVTSGTINIGTEVSGGATLAGTTVTAFLSGTLGGVGCYTVAAYPTVLNQIVRATAGLVGKNANPLNIPLAWATPQEGDGTDTTAATSSATVSVDMSAWTFSAGFTSTISVMGCTALTVTAAANSATNAQYSGTYATMLTNIVIAINLATANTVNIPANWVASQVRNTVFARANGNNLELMTRAGSAAYSTPTPLVALTFTNVTGASSQSWSGGSGGCWGYLVTFFASWPSGIAAAAYGVMSSTTLPLAGTMGNSTIGGETIRIRSGKNLWLNNTAGVGFNVGGSRLQPVELQIDAGTTWPADGSAPVLSLNCHTTFSNYLNIGIGIGAGAVVIRAPKYSDGTRALRFTVPAGTTGVIGAYCTSGLSWVNVDFDASASLSAYAQLYLYGNDTAYPTRFVGCRFKHSLNLPFIQSQSGRGAVEVIDTVFDNTGVATPNSAIYAGFGLHPNGMELVFEGCKFVGFPATSRLMAVGADVSSFITRVVFSNTNWGNVGSKGPVAMANGNSASQRAGAYISGFSQMGARDFFINTGPGFIDWDSAGGYPTCNAKLLDGMTGWVIKVILTTNTLKVNRLNPLELPRIGKLIPSNDDLVQAVRTLKLQLAVEQSMTLTRQDVSVLVVYENVAGVIQVVDTYDPAGGALTISSATWSSEVAGQVAFYPGPVLHNKLEISVTTPTAVKAGTEVGVFVRFGFSVTDSTKTIFVDPDIAVT